MNRPSFVEVWGNEVAWWNNEDGYPRALLTAPVKSPATLEILNILDDIRRREYLDVERLRGVCLELEGINHGQLSQESDLGDWPLQGMIVPSIQQADRTNEM